MCAREGVHGADVAQLEAGDLFGGGWAVGQGVVRVGAVGCVFGVAACVFLRMLA